ncbi:hypothetical protein J2Y54_000977 [Sphingomonas sp. BE123]|jgi:hypothetical protein|nr:hypothetical protein [Sphingomonas sp. BE123]
MTDTRPARQIWTDPRCTEYPVEELTAGSPFWPFWRLS